MDQTNGNQREGLQHEVHSGDATLAGPRGENLTGVGTFP